MAKASRPILISAALALLGSVGALLLGLFLIIVFLQVPSPPSSHGSRSSSFVLPAVFIALSAWGATTAIGLLRRRKWARVSILAFAALGLVEATAALIFLVVEGGPAPAGVSSSAAPYARAVLWAIHVPLLAVSLWWLVLFNSQTAIRHFCGDADDRPCRPAAITLIVWWLVLDALGKPVSAAMGLQACVYTMIFAGWGAAAVYLGSAVAQILVAWGILRLSRRVWPWAVGYLVLYFGNWVTTVAVACLRYRERIQSGVQLPPLVTPSFAINLIGTVITLTAVVVVIWRRDVFFAARALPISMGREFEGADSSTVLVKVDDIARGEAAMPDRVRPSEASSGGIEPPQASGTLTLGDVVRFQYFHSNRRLWPVTILAILMGLAGIVGVVLFAVVNRRMITDWVWALLFGLFVALQIAGPYINARVQYRKQKYLREPMRLTLADPGIRLQGPSFSTEIAWSLVQRVNETSSAFLIYQAPQMAWIVPKRFFPGEGEIQRWKQFLTGRLPDAEVFVEPGLIASLL